MAGSGQTLTPSLRAARPLPPSADIGPRGSPLVKLRNLLRLFPFLGDPFEAMQMDRRRIKREMAKAMREHGVSKYTR
jgi:hypothetical protein